MMDASPLAPIAGRLAPIVARLSTPHEGERLACVGALERVLASAGLGFVDLAAAIEAALDPGPTPAGDADAAQDDRELVQRAMAADFLTSWEQGFLSQVARRLMAGRAISDRQREVVRGIVSQRCA